MVSLFNKDDIVTLSPRILLSYDSVKLQIINNEHSATAHLKEDFVNHRYKVIRVNKTLYSDYDKIVKDPYWIEPYEYTLEEYVEYNPFKIRVGAGAFNEVNTLFTTDEFPHWEYIHLRKYPIDLKRLIFERASPREFPKTDCLDSIFTWSSTPEGHKYWCTLHEGDWRTILQYEFQLNLINDLKQESNNENQLQGEEAIVSRGDNFTGFRICNQKDQIAIRSGHLEYRRITF